MNKKLKRLFFFFGLCSMIFLPSCESTDDKINKQNSEIISYVDSEIDSLSNELIEKINETVARVEELEKEYDAKVIELELIDKQILEEQKSHDEKINVINTEIAAIKAKYESEMKALNEKHALLESEISAIEKDIVAFKVENDKKHADLEKEITEVETEITTLKTDYAAKVEELQNKDNQLNGEISSLESELAALKTEYELEKTALEEKQTLLEQELSNLKDENTQKHNELENEINQIESNLSTLKSDYIAKVEELQNKDNQLKDELTTLESNLIELEAKYELDKEALEEKQALLEEKLNELKTYVDSENAKMKEDVDSKVSELNKVDDEIKETIDLYNQQLTSLENSIVSLESKHKEDIAALNAAKEEILVELSEIKSSISALNATLLDEINEVRDEIQEIKDLLSSKDEEILKDIEELEKLISTLEQLIKSNSEKIASLEKQLEELKKEFEELEAKICTDHTVEKWTSFTSLQGDEFERGYCTNCNELIIREKEIDENITYYEGDDFKFRYLIANEIEITGYTGDEKDVIIPKHVNYNGYKYVVTSLGDNAFGDRRDLASVTIPNTITNIGNYAFDSCTAKIIWEENQVISTIGDYAFSNYNSNLSIPESVTHIGEGAFNGCQYLKNIVIPENVISIGNNAFASCTSIESIIIPKNVEYIGDGVFSSCRSLKSVIFEEGLEIDTISSSMFSHCSSLETIKIPDCVTTIGYSAFAGCNLLNSITIPENVTDIKGYAFESCSSLKTVEFAKNSKLELIDYGAFRECSALKTIIIPNSVKKIGRYAFEMCYALKYVSIPSSVSVVEYRAFSNCGYAIFTCEIASRPTGWDSLWNYYGITYWGVEENDLFSSNDIYYLLKEDCAVLISYFGDDSEVIIPSSINDGSINYPVKHIYEYAFAGSYLLESVIIPNTVETIGVASFMNCVSLKSIEIPESVTHIYDYAFCECVNLESITLPDSILAIGESAFELCNSLTNVYYKGTIEHWCYIEFSNNYSNPMSYGSHFYMLDENDAWYEVNSIDIPNTIEKIGNYQFYSFDNLSSVNVSNNIKEIGDCAFLDCYSLDNITLYAEINIGTDSFGSNTKINYDIENSDPESLATPSALCANNLALGDYTENVDFDSTFGFVTTSSKKITVDKNSKTVDGFSYSQRIKLNGTGSVSEGQRLIKVVIDGFAEVNIVAQSALAGADRNLVFANEYGTILDTLVIYGNSVTSVTFNASSSGTYYIYSESSGINIYSIQVNGGSLEGTPVASKHSVLEVVDISNDYFSADMLSIKVGAEYEAGAEMDVVIHSDLNMISDYNKNSYRVQINDRCYLPEVGTELNENGGYDLIYHVVMPDADATVYMLNCDNTEDAENGFNVSFEANEFVKMVGYNADAKYSGNFGALITWQWGFKPTAVEYQLAGATEWTDVVSYINLNRNYASVNFYGSDFTSDVTFRLTGEFVGCYEITYENEEFVTPGYAGLPTKALPGVSVNISWEDKDPYYSTGATIEGAEVSHSSDTYMSFTMPEGNVKITFNYAEKLPIKVNANENVVSGGVYDGYGLYKSEITTAKPGARIYVFAKVESGNVFTGASLNGGEPLAVTEGNYGKYVQFIVPEDATEVVITVYTESANAITYESNEELGTISGDAGASSGSTVTVKATPVDSYHYLADLVAKDSEGNVVLTKEDFTFDRDDENKATYVMPESDITLVATFAAHETTNIIVNLTDSTNVSYFKLSGYDSSVYTGIGETGTYIQGEEAGLSIDTICASSVPSKLIFMDAEGNVLFSADYEVDSWGYGSFGEFTIPEGYDTLIVDIEWTYQEAVSYTINDNGLEGYEIRYNEETWSGNYDTELGQLYSGDMFKISLYGDAGEGYVFVAKVTDTEGNPLTYSYGSYVVDGDFVITIEKVAVSKVTVVNTSENINANYVSFSAGGKYYNSGDSIPVGTNVIAYISGSVEFKVTVTCGDEVLFEGTAVSNGYNYECDIAFTVASGDIVVTYEEVVAEEPAAGYAGSYSTDSGITMEVNEDGTGYMDNGIIQITFTWEEIDGAFTMTYFNDPSYYFELDGVSVAEDGSIEVILIQDHEYPFTLTFVKA